MTRLLIVDDESLLRQGFMHMTDWETQGFQIVGEASNGKEALEIIAQKSPDIVVTDIKMPLMDGVELTKIIKEDYPGIQVVILSSYNDFEYVREMLRLGAFDYILKPKMNFTELLTVLQKASLATSQDNNTSKEPAFSDLRDTFFIDLINGNLTLNAIRDNFSKYRIPLEETNLIMLAVIFEPTRITLKSEERQLLINTINHTIDPAFNPISFFYNSNVAVTIFNCSLTSDGSIIGQICDDIITTVKIQTANDSQILISQQFNGYSRIAELFQELFAKLSFCFYFPKGRYQSVTHFETTSDYIAFDLRALNTLVDRFNFNKLHYTVTHWVEDQISRKNYIEPYILKKFFSEVCYLIIYKCLEIGLDWEDVNEKNLNASKKSKTPPTIKA